MNAKQKKQMMYVGLAVAAGAGIYFLSKGSAAAGGNYARLQTMREELTRNWGAGNPWIEKTMNYLQQAPEDVQRLYVDYWLDYHVMGRGGSAPAGMADQFQAINNQMTAAGAWPGPPQS